MGRLLVVLLATVLVMGIAVAMFPHAMYGIAFHAGQYGIPVGLLVACGVCCGFFKLTGK
jgi:hypothetical protein